MPFADRDDGVGAGEGTTGGEVTGGGGDDGRGRFSPSPLFSSIGAGAGAFGLFSGNPCAMRAPCVTSFFNEPSVSAVLRNVVGVGT